MYSFDSRVRYSECDASCTLTLVSLINYLQDCSTFQTEELGHGIDFLREHHIAWFLSAWQIEVFRMPRFLDPIRVSTWCHKATRTQAGRNFVISDPEGQVYVRADSLWFVYDTEAKRPVRIPDYEYVYLEDTPRLDMAPISRKLNVEGSFNELEPLTVHSHHLDSNGHVNNAHYVAFAADALAKHREGVHTASQQRISVQYRQMALLGDTIVPRVYEHADACTYSIALTSLEGEPFAIVRVGDLSYGFEGHSNE